MSRFTQRFLPILLAALMLFAGMAAFAATTDSAPETPTLSMQKSERSINSMLAESNASIQATLFSEFASSRLKYATVRSLNRCSGNKWMGFVDICEEFEDGEHVGYVLEQGVVQYGYGQLPEQTDSTTLKIGDVSSTLLYDGQAIFSYDNIDLDENALDSDVLLTVKYFDNDYDIGLIEVFPSSSLSSEAALKAMAPAYIDYIESGENFRLIDHAVLKLRSYISNYETGQRSYYWELYLVHGGELPAPVTQIRYYVSTGTVNIYERTLKDYF